MVKGKDKIPKGKITLPITGKLLQCNVCKRKLLVERVLMGVDHDVGISVTCWSCLPEEIQAKARRRYGVKGRVGIE